MLKNRIEGCPKCMPGQVRQPHPKALWPVRPGYCGARENVEARACEGHGSHSGSEEPKQHVSRCGHEVKCDMDMENPPNKYG